MKIEVVGGDTISRQVRTYAEYSVFAALTQFGDADRVREARVVLREATSGEGDRVVCTVTVALKDEESIRIRAIGPHACAAINRAVERIRTPATGLLADPMSP